jgi:hypothetical protein
MVTGFCVMFAGRSVWAVPQVADFGWRRLVPSSVLVFVTPLHTKAWLQFPGSWCGDPPPPAPLMDDFLERAREGRLWRWQTWAHAHLVATAAWAMNLPVDTERTAPRSTAGDGRWTVIWIGDIVHHMEHQSSFIRPDWGPLAEFLGLCKYVDEARWNDWDTRDARMQHLADHVLVAAPPDVIARVETVVAAMRSAIAEPAGSTPEPDFYRIRLLSHTASPDGEARYWALYRVSDQLIQLDDDSEFSARDRFMDRFRTMVDSNGWIDMGGERMRTEGYVIGDVLVLITTAEVHGVAEGTLAELRSR